MDIIREAAAGQCIQGCEGSFVQQQSTPYLIRRRRARTAHLGKGQVQKSYDSRQNKLRQNIFTYKPLLFLFEPFSNPAADKYSWVEADKKEVIWLNDFCWSKALIEWKSFLLLLKGDQVNLPAPKNHYATDVCIDHDVLIFATSKDAIKYRGPYNTEDKNEDDMMTSRWKVFYFTHSNPEEEQKDIAPCPHCFSKLALMGEIS